ncbi:protein ecdysoneless homolog [Prosopis cineraria]|uniref:protein ecdysoneless homolog n=1 Tax=Prosopis cineraria TaxID=364024 RepID=UPI00240FAC10|nr:protein ecdysoneless homolog [Prosopis cineraria]XP_054823004.1 protein ecdysoneless homolog [Prosopis cineraria]
MAAAADESSSFTSSSIFSQKSSRLPDDTVFYAIFPDLILNPTTPNDQSSLQSLHLQIIQSLSPFTTDYIWQHEPFTLSLSSTPKSSCFCSSDLPHLHGKVRFGDNLEDEWFTVFLLFQISLHFPSLSIRVWDTDGEFLLIEAAFHLPRWVNPDNSLNRVFIRQGDLHIVPRNRLPSPSLADSLKFLVRCGAESRSSESVQKAVKKKISDYPDRARKNMHRVRVRVPVSVAQVLKQEPCMISLAVEGFYDRDIDTMKFAATMEKFLGRGKDEEMVCVSVKMSRAMYAQLVQQTFQAPKCFPMPSRSDLSVYMEAELGMKIACGFEMMYQQRKRDGVEGKGSTWEAFKQTLERSGYFQGLLPGSKEYQRLMQNAEEYYRNNSLYSRVSDLMSAPVRRIDEILALPHSVDDFKNQKVPPSDDDSWLYNGEEELTSALLERQKEMELYDLKQKKGKGKEKQDLSSVSNAREFDPGDMAKTMQAFVHKVSSYKGAEAPESMNKEVNLDVDQFIKDMESIMKHQGVKEDDSDVEEGSSSELDLDDSDEGDMVEPDNEDGGDTFVQSYSDAMNEELKATTLGRSFVRANEQLPKKDEGTSNTRENMDEDFSPVDVDLNLVKSFLDSFSSQQGLPGPASNLLGLMGVQFPQDADKGK